MPLVADHPPLTMQEAFDLTVTRLFDGKGRCMNDDRCTYRDPHNTNSCAVGCHIPDSLNPSQLDDPDDNPSAVHAPRVQSWLERHHIYAFDISPGSVGLGFLNALQVIHDTTSCWDREDPTRLSPQGRRRLRDTARRYSLTILPILQE